MDSVLTFTLLGLGAVTLLTRCFFFILDRELPFPAWAQRGLQYAPIAALAAVVVPEVLVSHGAFITTWQDARLYGAAAGVAFYLARRGQGQAVLAPSWWVCRCICRCTWAGVGKPRHGLASGRCGSCQSRDSPSPPPKIKKTNISAP